MPSNRITVNRQDDLSWEVPDSAMNAVVIVLDALGDRDPGNTLGLCLEIDDSSVSPEEVERLRRLLREPGKVKPLLNLPQRAN